MSTIAATVKTPNGGKYVRQLCKHWSHKLETEVDGGDEHCRGTVTFPNAVTVMDADAEGITITITGEDHDAVQGLTDVVARHIDRFAFREDALVYDWAWKD